MFAGKKSAQIREILISESAWEEMTCLFAPSLGTSITPVREALLRLVSSGALHATPAQAFLVPEVTLERYNEINAIRKQLEPMAVAAAC